MTNSNTFTTAVFDYVKQYITDNFKKVVISDSTKSALVTDTAVDSVILTKQITDLVFSSNVATFTLELDLDEANGKTLRRVGILNNSDTLMVQESVTAFNKTANDTYKLTFRTTVTV
jgi:hypothetical protein